MNYKSIFFACVISVSCASFGGIDQELLAAAKSGDLTGVKSAVGRGANINAADTDLGFTALHWAIWKGSLEICTYLLACGAKVESCSLRGLTPLSWAVQFGNLALVTLLVRHGAETTKPLERARQYEQQGVVALLSLFSGSSSGQ